MKRTDTDALVFWATDLSNFLTCPHKTSRDRAVQFGAPRPRPYPDPGAEVLQKRGEEHEANYLESLRAERLTVATIPPVDGEMEYEPRRRAGAERTVEAMRAGPDVIFQGILFDGRWGGKPDFLVKTDTPSDLGDWSYEVVDAKLAREAKAGALLQISLYSDLLGEAQGTQPEYMSLALGGMPPAVERFRVDDYAAYYRMVRARFEEFALADPPPTYPEPVDHCVICHWSEECRKKRREDDHLSLVAGIARSHRGVLEGRRVVTLEALGRLNLPLDLAPEGLSSTSLDRIHNQARVQLEGRESGENVREFLVPVVEGKGFAVLPEPSPGDLFFDIEGDRWALEGGLEYLFGYVDVEGEFTGLRALDRAEEKEAFEDFIDTVMERLERWPDMHVYHYAAYETTAMKTLAGRHATRVEEVDHLLRGEVFVDLYRVVRQGLRASVESYSIKRMEPFYDFERDVSLRDATGALVNFEAWLGMGAEGEGSDELLRLIEAYNKDDCISTLRLRDWLESLRPELEAHTGEPVPRPAAPEAEPSEELSEERERIAALAARLTAGVSEDPDERLPEENARWILAHLLDHHRREKKAMWWQYFTWREMDSDQLIEDRSTLGGLEYVGLGEIIKRSQIHRYRYPPQEHSIDVGDDARDPVTGSSAGSVEAVDELARTIDLKRGLTSDKPHPAALIPLKDVPDGVLRQSLERLATDLADHGFEGDADRSAAVDLLLRKRPRVDGPAGSELMGEGEDRLSAARRLVAELDDSVLPIQGPPGSGKTYTGGRMVVALLEQGKKVGVTGPSHKVISNFLESICDAAEEAGFSFSGIQKCSEAQWCGHDEISIGSNSEVRDGLADGSFSLAAGTAWLWSREEMAGAVDVLFVDEAGQFSLANTLAVTQAAESVVLLGDPSQLEQPSQGVHPEGTGVSALEHILGNERTLPPDRGLFLEQTWRLHPDICEFTSEQYYESRLSSRPRLEGQSVSGPAPFDGSGLRFVPVSHTGNRNSSDEEVEMVAALIAALFGARATWTDSDGTVAALGLEDVLVIAPYNAQVNALIEALPEGVRVGTVDKFQGQEAPIVICSMATSSPTEAPRGMEFLYSANRLNVATSRARCVAVIVGSPDLFAPECKSVRQMWLANGFCRYMELAE